MSTLEQELIDRIRQMDEEERKRLLEQLQKDAETKGFDFDQWLKQVRSFRAKLRAKYGSLHYFGVQEMLDEIREEASWPRW